MATQRRVAMPPWAFTLALLLCEAALRCEARAACSRLPARSPLRRAMARGGSAEPSGDPLIQEAHQDESGFLFHRADLARLF